MTFTLLTGGQAFSMNQELPGRPAALANEHGEHITAPRALAELDMDRKGLILRYADGTTDRVPAGARISVGSLA